ncbi:hypothetical protein PFUGPA_04583 [Plasmodium falciparum Palo Alto/Uganda]|uniref:Uncharacterized protein n=2 Tax=Plasmodium falciparum TaxID=5833 RepID=A0A024WBR5_PLAFA|nr:hypothetical protein PFTANZ_01071 [Plasmodium falciparum Tanzania (2000708)]ETW53567.1 hypothetical protein PFUGPA_04583 [Plasmodium falciparum Palo Alto/Uganda]
MYIRIMGEDSIYINLENKARKKNPDNYIKILGRKKKKIKLFIFLNTCNLFFPTYLLYVLFFNIYQFLHSININNKNKFINPGACVFII